MTEKPTSWTPPSTHKYSDPIQKVDPLFPSAQEVKTLLLEAKKAPDVKKAAGDLKDPLQYLPPEFLRQVARALKSGADKYGRRNWALSGLKLDTYVGSLLRHTLAMADGEWIDPDSGESHVAMIGANAAVLIDCDHLGLLEGKDGPKPEQLVK